MNLKYLISIPAFAFICSFANSQTFDINAEANKAGFSGIHMLGAHFVYNDEKDIIYNDNTFANWARRAGYKTARFPGGTVIQTWDWNDPTGLQKPEVDYWDQPDPVKVDPARWMSLDEYLRFARIAEIRPLIGINLLSGARFGRIDDSVKRAGEQVRYVMSKGFRGAFYYLGNEDMHEMGGLEAAADIFRRHAMEIKRIDPSAKLFWNDNIVGLNNNTRLEKFLGIVGRSPEGMPYADGVEFHAKWPGDEDTIAEPVTLDFWRSQVPLNIAGRGVFSERASALRAKAAAAGYPSLMLANNEWGLSQFKGEIFQRFSRYDYSLVAIDYLQDLFIGQYDVAAFWSNVAADKNGTPDREMKRLIDTSNGNRLNPMHLGFEMLASAQGQKIANVLDRTSGSVSRNPSCYGFAAFGNGRFEVFLMNKSTNPANVDIKIRGISLGNQRAVKKSLIDTADHWGEVTVEYVPLQNNKMIFTLPPMSYTKIQLSGIPGTW